eukprot:SAG22_NODE_3387_length_1740_cov_1.117611_1_plen_174_part_10
MMVTHHVCNPAALPCHAASDTDGNGEVDFAEFKAWYTKQGKVAQQSLITVHYRSKAGEHCQTNAAALPKLVANGDVDGETLVWVEGLSAWAPLKEAQTEAAALGEVLGSLGTAGAKTADEVEALFQAIDVDGDGSLTLDEFTAACRLTVDDSKLAEKVFGQVRLAGWLAGWLAG